MMRQLPVIVLCLAACSFAGEDPIKIEATQDATISGTKNGDSGGDGKAASFRLMAVDSEKHRALLFFELKGQRPCSAAVLRLTTDKCWINEKLQYIRAQRLLRPFQEHRATWNNSYEVDTWINPGGDFDPAAACARKLTKEDNGENKIIEFNVTALVQAWLSKAALNHGLLLTLEDGSDVNAHFHSKESKDSHKRPQLLLYYAAQPPKIPEMMSVNTIKPLGSMPQLKMDVMAQGSTQGKLSSDMQARFYGRGGVAPYSFKASGLPEGLTLGADGSLTGKPTKLGTFKVTVTAEGADRRSATLRLEMLIAEALKAGAADPKKDPVVTKPPVKPVGEE